MAKITKNPTSSANWANTDNLLNIRPLLIHVEGKCCLPWCRFAPLMISEGRLIFNFSLNLGRHPLVHVVPLRSDIFIKFKKYPTKYGNFTLESKFCCQINTFWRLIGRFEIRIVQSLPTTVVGHKVGRHKVGLFPIFEKVYSAIKWDSENFE